MRVSEELFARGEGWGPVQEHLTHRCIPSLAVPVAAVTTSAAAVAAAADAAVFFGYGFSVLTQKSNGKSF